MEPCRSEGAFYATEESRMTTVIARNLGAFRQVFSKEFFIHGN